MNRKIKCAEGRSVCPVKLSAYIEGSQGLADTFLDEVVCDASRRVLVENRVHQSDLGGAASRFGLGGTELADGNTPISSSFNLDVARCCNYAARRPVSLKTQAF